MDFEWDDTKAESNEQKHGVAFSEALTVFADPLCRSRVTIPATPTTKTAFLLWAFRSMDGCWWCRTRIAVTWSASSAPGRRPGASERTTRMATSPDDPELTDDLQPEYDFRSLRGVVRGKYAARYRERLRVVRLAPDVSAAFADEAAVNDALREYLSWRGQSQAVNLP
jgi:hypothetical protein